RSLAVVGNQDDACVCRCRSPFPTQQRDANRLECNRAYDGSHDCIPPLRAAEPENEQYLNRQRDEKQPKTGKGREIATQKESCSENGKKPMIGRSARPGKASQGCQGQDRQRCFEK